MESCMLVLMPIRPHLRFILGNAFVALILLLGGAACVITSVNLKNHETIMYDVNTTGTATQISPIALAFEYSYSFDSHQYSDTWLPIKKYSNTTPVIVMCASRRPNCNYILNIPGYQLYGTRSFFCGSIISSTWFWPLLMSTGIVSMTFGCVFGFVVAQRVVGS